MIKLSDRTLSMLQSECDSGHVTKAVGDKSLGIGHFSPALQSSLAEDAKADGTGAIIGDQIASLVAQIVVALKGPKVQDKPATPPVAPPKPAVAPPPANVPPPVHPVANPPAAQHHVPK